MNEARGAVSNGGRWMQGLEASKVLSVVERGLD